MAKTSSSGVNQVGNNFYVTEVRENTDGTFSSTLYRTNAQGEGGVPISGSFADSTGKTSAINEANATAEEKALLANPNSQLSKTSQDQIKSTKGDFFPGDAKPSDVGNGGSSNSPTSAGKSQPTAQYYMYPLDMPDTQDKIKFTAVEYQPSGAAGKGGNPGQIGAKNRSSPRGGTSVFLPIQASITDNNAVEWNQDSLNEIQMQAANTAIGAMTAKTEDLSKVMGEAYNKALKGLKDSQREAKIAFAGEAIGAQNLLGRYGKVLNPNLELLFSAPTLRPFNFAFKMTARDEAEAKNIKAIIKFFKNNMAPKKGKNKIFLQTPNTFFIEYQGNPAPAINLVKECALLSCSVDYTPNQTYMTYPDGTMTSYTITMTFQELEPIYFEDYTEGAGASHPIGY